MLNEAMIDIVERSLQKGCNVLISPSDNGRIVIKVTTQQTVYDTKTQKK